MKQDVFMWVGGGGGEGVGPGGGGGALGQRIAVGGNLYASASPAMDVRGSLSSPSPALTRPFSHF
jgi:hypothetical protein